MILIIPIQLIGILLIIQLVAVISIHLQNPVILFTTQV